MKPWTFWWKYQFGRYIVILPTLYMLATGVSDTEIQQDLLTKDDLTLDTAEKRAIAKESAKFSQAGLTDEKLQNVKSTSDFSFSLFNSIQHI